MKNILLLTNIYVQTDFYTLNNTAVCHYFAKEWVRLGYNVHVVYNYPIYWKPFHWLSKVLGEKIASLGGSQITTKYLSDIESYTIDGVLVHRIPIFKFAPKMKYSDKVLEKQVEHIIKIADKFHFVPDIILGHFQYPSIALLYELKKRFSCKISLVLHGDSKRLKYLCGDRFQEYFSSVDIWGFRSLPIKRNFEKYYGIQKFSFLCPSGVSDIFFKKNIRKWKGGNLKSFIYVGSFIKRKFPSVIVEALGEVYKKDEFVMTFVGHGDECKTIKKKIRKFHFEKNVVFTGQLSREFIIDYLGYSECFIMVSKGETFGLVYLEAMAAGCIVIASKQEGMEGIITDGVNGFLCEAGNSHELAKKMQYINSLTANEKMKISENAIKTASLLTDKTVAIKYLNSVISV